MNISATSALVLNWSDLSLWRTEQASAYLKQLDLSDGDPLLAQFSPEDRLMHVQVVTGRKYFMLRQILGFMETGEGKGQIVILAAGMAPISIEIAARFPQSHVFDVDKFLMSEKSRLVNGNPPNIEFITCDISDIHALDTELTRHGFDPALPTIAILEGIVYYLHTDDIVRILNYFYDMGGTAACDFCLKPELLDTQYQRYPVEIFQKIRNYVTLDFIQFYSWEEITQVFSRAGFTSVHPTNMQEIQKERTGDILPFPTADSSWIQMLYGM